MPKVDGEMIDEPLHIRSLLVPCRQAMHREGMPEIVQPRLITTAIGSLHPGMSPQTDKRMMQRPAANRRPVSADEEATADADRWMCERPAKMRNR